MPVPLDLIGQRFGRLLIVAKGGHRGVGKLQKRLWLCRCDCNAEKMISTGSLRNGDSKSCGCLKRDMAKTISATHGKSKTPEYRNWGSMIERCTNVGGFHYGKYGAKGIRVCDRWRSSFESFLSDMGPRPSPSHTIDRINNNGNYSPENCRWATPKQQSQNRGERRRRRKPEATSNIRPITAPAEIVSSLRVLMTILERTHA